MSTVLILSCGGLGWPAVTAELVEAGHTVVGVDSREDHHGKYLSDTFYQVPRHENTEMYIERIREIVSREGIDYISGGATRELVILQEHGFENVLASDPAALRTTEDKHETYRRFSDISPDFARVDTVEELHNAAERMGFPDRTLCFKPVIGSGARGFRVLVDNYNKTKWTFEYKTDPHMTIDELSQLDFPPLLLMEYLEGPVYHVDVLAENGAIVKAVVSRRISERFGFGFSLECVNRPEYIEMAEKVVGDLGLDYNCFVQIMDGKLLEVGGRCQGSVGVGLNLVTGSLELAAGRVPDTTVRPVRMIRYWKELFVDPATDELAMTRDFP